MSRLTVENIKILNEVIDRQIVYMHGISVERTRQCVRTALKLMRYKREISESRYMALLDLNEKIAYEYKYR